MMGGLQGGIADGFDYLLQEVENCICMNDASMKADDSEVNSDSRMAAYDIGQLCCQRQHESRFNSGLLRTH